MIKKLRYLCTLLLLAVVSGAWAETKSITFSELGLENGVQYTAPFTNGDVSVTFAGGANDGKYYTTGSGIRTYGNGTITIAANGKTITSIALTFSGTDYAPASGDVWTCDGTGTGTYGVDASWEGSATEVVLTRPTGSGHWRLQKVEVTFGNPTCATPTFSPGEGTFTSAQSVSISCTTSGATIYYTIDGNDPTTSSSVYSSPIAVSTTTTIKAIAVKSGMDNSEVATATYMIVNIEHAGTESDPYTVADARNAIDVGEGLADVYATGIVSAIPTAYDSSYKNITFNFVDNEGDANFLQAYRCTGDDAADVTVGDVVVVKGTLTKFGSTYEFAQGCTLVSLTHPVGSVEKPTFSPAAGTYSSAQNVTISCATDGSTIYYTTDGTDPTDASNKYTSAISVSTTTTIKAIAIKGETQSVVATATYHICSAEAPYTVAQALAFHEYPANGIYVHGIVSTAPTQAPTEAGQLTYYISDNGEATDQLQVYKGKGLEQAAFTAQDDIQDGDIVTIYGNVKIYNNTKEFDTNNYLVSFERPDAPVTVPAPTFNPAAGEVEAGTTVEIVCPEEADGVQYSFDEETWKEYTAPIEITEETTIYARAYDEEGNRSVVVSAKYTIKAVTPAQDVVIVEDGKTTFLFNTEGNEWGFPVGSANKTVDEKEFTANDKTITVAGSEGNGYYYSTSAEKYLLMGKSGAYLTLPAFDFEVGKIEVVGTSVASESVKQNIFVGDDAVSTETTGAKNVTNTYVIDADYRAAGNVYTLKVTSAHNTQISQIIVYKYTGEEKSDPQLKFSAATATATLGSEFAAPELTYVEGFDGTVKYESDNTDVATVDATTGEVTLVAAGDAIIKATSEETDHYLAGEASYTLTVKEAPVVGDDKYELVTDVAKLVAGTEILISYVDDDGATVMGEQKTSNRSGVAAAVNQDGTITPNNDAQVIVLEGDSENGWYFNVGTGYLYASSNTANQLKTETTIDENGNAKATISIEDGDVTIQFQGNNSRNTMRFNPNNGSPLFACYASNSTTGFLPQIYRKVTSTETLLGDVNGDTKVDVADVTALVNIIVNGTEPTAEQLAAGDFDNSGTLTTTDVEALVELILSNQ